MTINTNTPSNMLFGALLFWDSMAKPQHLDSPSVDWRYPIQTNPDKFNLADTRSVRTCYRSKRIDITALAGLGLAGINASVFVQNTDYLIPGAVRLYLWRPTISKQELLVMNVISSGWNGSFSSGFRHSAGGGTTPLVSSAPIVIGMKYTLTWATTNNNAYVNDHVQLTVGGVPVVVADYMNNSTPNINNTSGSFTFTAVSTSSLSVVPTSNYAGTMKFSLSTWFNIPSISASNGTEDFLELICNTRSVTQGMAIGSASVNSMFDYMQVVVMQPCSGVGVYVGPQAIDPGPVVGPAT
jgi:hypothetical protein